MNMKDEYLASITRKIKALKLRRVCETNEVININASRKLEGSTRYNTSKRHL